MFLNITLCMQRFETNLSNDSGVQPKKFNTIKYDIRFKMVVNKNQDPSGCFFLIKTN